MPRRTWGKLSVNGIISKIGRMAASKAAAFGYAVAVGVAGNLAFNFVQEHHAATAVTAPREVGHAVAALAPNPMPAVATRQSRPAAPARAITPAPPLPEPRVTAVLPNPASLPPPAMQPAVLPSAAAAPAPSAAVPLPPAVSALLDPRRLAGPPRQPASVANRTAPRLQPVPPGVTAPAAPSPAPSPPPPQVAALPPLGPAIDVAPLPTPPDRAATPAVMAALPPPAKLTASKPTASELAASEPAPRGFAFSDVWHPYYRAVTNGIHWAGRHVPLVGDSDAAPQAEAAASGAPISLLPPAALERTEAAPPRKPTAPGPGSGGLY